MHYALTDAERILLHLNLAHLGDRQGAHWKYHMGMAWDFILRGIGS